mmetsp:Transcript_5410/g.22431  ORF Transcript_5410/g.22431 Transcript_5410/m.22431 type:complete len:189 (-) Transcript_5410:1388-1954(-)
MWPQPDCPGYPDYDRNAGVPCWQTKCGGPAVPPASCWNGTLLCQHGTDECRVNAIEACAAQLAPSLAIPFAACAESAYPDGGPACADAMGLDWTAIESCADSEQQTYEMAVAFGKATAAFKPAGTPTIALNGQIVDDTADLTAAVCALYAGPSKPEACGAVFAAEDDELDAVPGGLRGGAPSVLATAA